MYLKKGFVLYKFKSLISINKRKKQKKPKMLFKKKKKIQYVNREMRWRQA